MGKSIAILNSNCVRFGHKIENGKLWSGRQFAKMQNIVARPFLYMWKLLQICMGGYYTPTDLCEQSQCYAKQKLHQCRIGHWCNFL